MSGKYAQLFEDVDAGLEGFSSEFRNYFYSYVFQRSIENLNNLMDEKFKKYTETCRIYQNQIKEMEFLILDDDLHIESIQETIESLKEERQQEIQRMEDHYQNLIDEAVLNIKSFGIKNNSGIQLIEEKFKLDLYSLVNDFIIPKKSK